MQNHKINRDLIWAWAFFAVTALYVFARTWNLTASCLWFDEIFGVHAATLAWAEMFEFVRADLIHPPLFYALLKIWIAIGGESLGWLRLFPVFWSTLAIAPFVLLSRALRLSKFEIITAFVLLATNGALIRYAQEVRMYSLLFCLALWSLWLFVQFINDTPAQKSPKLNQLNLLWLFAVNLLLVYTHYFGWLLIFTQLLAVCFFKRNKFWQFLISLAALLGAFSPWIFVVSQAALTNANLAQNIGWQAKPNLSKIFGFFLQLAEPFYYQQSNVDQANFYWLAVPTSLVCLLAILANFKNERLKLPAFFAFAPIIVAFAASWILPHSIWGTRHLIIVFPAFAVAAAIALNNLPFKQLKIAAIIVLLVCSSAAGFRYFTAPPTIFIWCGWRELAAQASAVEQNEPATIYAFEDDAAYYLWYALRGNRNFKIVLINGYADMPKDAAYFLPRGFADVQVSDNSQISGARFWLAFRDAKSPANKQVLRDLQQQNYQISQSLEFRAQGVTAFLVKAEK